MRDSDNQPSIDERPDFDPAVPVGEENRGSDQSRRTFLGTSAASLGAFGLGSTTRVADRNESGDHPQFAAAEHDHSGEYGGTARLGAQNPVESITVRNLQTTESPVVNVKSYGVVGDGEIDDTAALQDAVDAATPHGILHIPYDLQVRLEDTVTVDLNTGRDSNEQNRFALLCEGALTPTPGIGAAIEIRGGFTPYVFMRVQNGGKDVETDSAIRVTGNRGGLFEGWGRNYDGRLFHFEESATYSVGHLKTWNCGQSVGVFDASPMGEIGDIFDVSPTRAPEFHDSTDICINQYENYQAEGVTERGIFFDDCLSVFLDTVAVGGTAETPPAEFRDCENMFVNALHLGGSPTWGGVIENVTNSTFRIVCNIIQKGIRYTGGKTDGNRIVLNAMNLFEAGLVVESDVAGGYHYFAGNVSRTDARALDIRTDDAEIHLDNFYAVGNAGGDLEVPPDNDVHLTNCRIESIDGSPRTVNGVGTEAAARERPTDAKWHVGNQVLFTDTEDGSGDGLYLRAAPDRWVKFGDIELFDADPDVGGVLVSQGKHTAVPATLEADGSFGQSFTVAHPVSEIEFLPATFGNPDTAATMTLYEGDPDSELVELDHQRIESLPDTQQVVLDVGTKSSGTFYLEMTNPDGTPTWWWHDEDDLADVGGIAYVDRERVDDTNFVFTARR